MPTEPSSVSFGPLELLSFGALSTIVSRAAFAFTEIANLCQECFRPRVEEVSRFLDTRERPSREEPSRLD
jgi:hypothetical protein